MTQLCLTPPNSLVILIKFFGKFGKNLLYKEVIFQINNLEKNIYIDDKRFKLPTLN